MDNKITILKSLVGSRAHGLHHDGSDYDYRAVHVIPTKEILSLGFKYSPTSWIEGDVDETSYEIGHFLQLCTKANPSVLEVLLSHKRQVDSHYAQQMRDLLPFMYDPKDAFNAFAGYSKNQQKKLLDNHLNRKNKFAVAYIRTSFNLIDLLETGNFYLEVLRPSTKELLIRASAGDFSDGEVIDIAERNLTKAKEILPDVPNRQDLKMINDFLLRIRKDFL